MYDADKHTQVEGFIMSWTLKLTYAGVVIIFVCKIIALLSQYVTSGKIATDIVKYFIDAIKAILTGGA